MILLALLVVDLMNDGVVDEAEGDERA